MGPRVLQKYFLKHINMKHKTVKLELTKHLVFCFYNLNIEATSSSNNVLSKVTARDKLAPYSCILN